MSRKLRYILQFRQHCEAINSVYKIRFFQYCTSNTKKPAVAPPVYVKNDDDFKVAKKYTLKSLETLFNIKTFQANELILRSNNLSKVNSALIKENFRSLVQKGVTKETLLKHPDLLAVTDMYLRLEQINKLTYNINTTAELITLPLLELRGIVYEEMTLGSENGRIKSLSKALKVSEERVCHLLCSKPFLSSISLEKVTSTINLLINFGVIPEDICSDLWVLRYTEKTITSRLSEAKQCNVENMKTWMVRAQPEILQNYIRRRSDNKLILEDRSLGEYLSERLDCSPEIATYIILKQPALKNKSLKKLKELIDFIYSAGFKPHHICRVPKILVHSVVTIKKRLKELEEKDFHLDSLHMLTKSKKQFTQYYEALGKSKIKSKV